MNELKVGKEELEFCLGRSLKDVQDKPHCIARSGSGFLSCVLTAAGCDGALWGGNAPIEDSDGEPLVNADVLTRFRAWELGKNQAWLRRQGAFAVLSQFSMVIPGNTSEEVVSRMYSEVENDGMYDLFYDDCLEKLMTKWINEVDWSYVPLTDETDLALWVTANDEELARKVTTALSRAGISTTRI